MSYLNRKRKQNEGFTLIELLITIVVVGILTTVVIIGVGSLTNSGNTATCQASADASVAASSVHFANTNAWPTDFNSMVTAKELKLPTNVSPAEPLPAGTTALTFNGKTLTLTAPLVAGDPPTFVCT
ncbi:MAG: type II secretion system GspH family protein [Actinomycetota bacterium]|nr:type II secretion system GspH family protein [Actinomycetota bacterium]